MDGLSVLEIRSVIDSRPVRHLWPTGLGEGAEGLAGWEDHVESLPVDDGVSELKALVPGVDSSVVVT